MRPLVLMVWFGSVCARWTPSWAVFATGWCCLILAGLARLLCSLAVLLVARLRGGLALERTVCVRP